MKMHRYTFGLSVFSVGVMLSLLLGTLHITSQKTAAAVEDNNSNGIVYVIPVKQTIESGLESFLRRAFSEAERAGADHIILDLDTFGGAVIAAEGIGTLVRGSSIPTIAYVNGKAISAGSYIALNADQIAMGSGSSIGAAAVVLISGERVEDSKTISMWVGHMRSAAEMNNRNPDYAEAMVDDQRVIEISEIDKTIRKGELLTFTAEEAVKAGYAELEADNFSEVLAFIGASDYEIIEVSASPAESLARVLTHPIVMTILMLVGIAGIAIELFVPGFGVPGIVGIGSFALYFFGHFVAGFAGIEHLFLFLAGVVLLIIEVFVPSFGIFGIAGIISVVSGVVLAAYNTEQALLSLGIASILAIVIIVFVTRYFKTKGVWNKFILLDQTSAETGYSSQESKQHLMGKTGICITSLRPAGTAEIEDERIDVVSSGGFISVNQEIIVIKIEGTRVVVRELKKD